MTALSAQLLPLARAAELQACSAGAVTWALDLCLPQSGVDWAKMVCTSMETGQIFWSDPWKRHGLHTPADSPCSWS